MKELPLQSVVNLRDFGATQTKDLKTVKSGQSDARIVDFRNRVLTESEILSE